MISVGIKVLGSALHLVRGLIKIRFFNCKSPNLNESNNDFFKVYSIIFYWTVNILNIFLLKN